MTSSEQINWVTRWTSKAPAAIAIVEVHGPDAQTFVRVFWQPAQGSAQLLSDRIRYGLWTSGPGSAGEQVVVCAIHDESIEVHCHGGVAAADQILADLVSVGCRDCPPDDIVHRISRDPYVAQAEVDLTKAVTANVAGVLLAQTRGALSRAMAAIRDPQQASGRSVVEQCHTLLARAAFGLHLLQPWQILLTGPPNVGKSSLLNAVLGFERAIIHPTAGTTRDLIAEVTSLEGWPVLLTDSAGLRKTDDAVESAGVRATENALNDVDTILLLVDSTVGWTSAQQSVWEKYSQKCFCVVTKIDQQNQIHEEIPVPIFARTSAESGEGIDAMLAALVKTYLPQDFPNDLDYTDYAVPFRDSHINEIRALLQAPTDGKIKT